MSLLAMFVSRSRVAMAQLAAAIEAGEPAAAARMAHGLKGSSAVVGAARVSAVSASLCDALSAGGLLEAAALQVELDRTFELTEAAFTASSEELSR